MFYANFFPAIISYALINHNGSGHGSTTSNNRLNLESWCSGLRMNGALPLLRRHWSREPWNAAEWCQSFRGPTL